MTSYTWPFGRGKTGRGKTGRAKKFLNEGLPYFWGLFWIKYIPILYNNTKIQIDKFILKKSIFIIFLEIQSIDPDPVHGTPL